MTRFVTLALVAVLALSASQAAFAHSGSGSHGSACKPCGSNHCGSSSCKTSGPGKYMGGSKNGPIGTPENPFKPVTVSSNGFVWVNGHWERPRAGQTTIVDPTLTGPVVRDHRGMPSTVVIDPNSGYRYGGGRFSTLTPTSTSIVRDHRGTTSTSNTVTGVGASPVDSAIGGLAGLGNTLENGLTGIGNAFGIGYGSITPAVPSGVRDHRTTDTSNFGYNVRDHRS